VYVLFPELAAKRYAHWPYNVLPEYPSYAAEPLVKVDVPSLTVIVCELVSHVEHTVIKSPAATDVKEQAMDVCEVELLELYPQDCT
jgi:hypothetical protein